MSNRTTRKTIDPTDLGNRRDELVRRLSDGDVQISDAKRAGADTIRWENHWITLLREYEAVCNQLGETETRPYPEAA